MGSRTFHVRAVVAAGATAALSVTGLVASTPAAQAASAIPTVTVHVTAKNITFSGGGATTANGVTTLHAGRVHFHVTTGLGDHTLQLARFHNGYTAQQAQKDFQSAFNGDVAAIDRIDHGVVFRGGAEATPHHPGDMVVSLAKGQFLATDQNGNAGAVLQVVGTAASRVGQPVTGYFTAYTYGWVTSSSLPAKGWVNVANHADQPHFLVLQHVKSNTTSKMVRDFIKAGGDSQPSWGLKEAAQSGVVSPGTSQKVTYDLPPGKYLVACFWPDYFTGMPHMMMGMWKLVTLH